MYNTKRSVGVSLVGDDLESSEKNAFASFVKAGSTDGK